MNESKQAENPPELLRSTPTDQRAAAPEGSLVYERISKVQSDLFAIREELRDTIGDAKDARFIRLCAEIGALADEFLPEEKNAQN